MSRALTEESKDEMDWYARAGEDRSQEDRQMDGGYDAEPEIDWGGQLEDEDHDPLWDDPDAWEGVGEERKRYVIRTGEARVER